MDRVLIHFPLLRASPSHLVCWQTASQIGKHMARCIYQGVIWLYPFSSSLDRLFSQYTTTYGCAFSSCIACGLVAVTDGIYGHGTYCSVHREMGSLIAIISRSFVHNTCMDTAPVLIRCPDPYCTLSGIVLFTSKFVSKVHGCSLLPYNLKIESMT